MLYDLVGKYMSQGRSTPYVGDGRLIPPLYNRNPYFMGPYKPLRNLG